MKRKCQECDKEYDDALLEEGSSLLCPECQMKHGPVVDPDPLYKIMCDLKTVRLYCRDPTVHGRDKEETIVIESIGDILASLVSIVVAMRLRKHQAGLR